nr:PucR family transcriptional regulator ligand-binding domain-containing protein [Actinomadura sp. WAC 06369]
MRLRSLLAMPLRLEVVTGEDELDRTIRWVVTTDLLDPGRYLRGRELVLTGLVWRTGPADSETFVSALAAAGVSALAAWDLASGTVPDDLVAACERHRLPLFKVPEDVAFATVTEEVVRRLSGARAADLTAVLDRHRRLVADRGAGLDAVLDLLDRDLGMRCWVLAPTGRVVAGPPAPAPPDALARAFLTAPRLPHHLADPGVTLFPVAEDATSRVADWFLACAGDAADWPPERRALAAELAAIAALERARLDDRLGVEGRVAQELVRLVAAAAPPDEIAPASNSRASTPRRRSSRSPPRGAGPCGRASCARSSRRPRRSPAPSWACSTTRPSRSSPPPRTRTSPAACRPPCGPSPPASPAPASPWASATSSPPPNCAAPSRRRAARAASPPAAPTPCAPIPYTSTPCASSGTTSSPPTSCCSRACRTTSARCSRCGSSPRCGATTTPTRRT